MTLNTIDYPFLEVVYCAYVSTHHSLHIKFEVSTFTHSRDMMGPQSFKMGHVTLTIPFGGDVPSHSIWPTCVQNFMTLASAIPEI